MRRLIRSTTSTTSASTSLRRKCGCPQTEIIRGRTFRSWQNPREPRYDDPARKVDSVFDNVGDDKVKRPYGGWDHEARIGQGSIVASAAAMLTFADNYHVRWESVDPTDTDPSDDALIGERISNVPLPRNLWHDGALAGTNTILYQRTDGIRIFANFNARTQIEDGPHYGEGVRILVRDWIDANGMPDIDRTSDGFWTIPQGGAGKNLGGYDAPFNSFLQAVGNTTAGSKVRLFAGKSNFTGVIKKRMRLDAPLGAATIGKP